MTLDDLKKGERKYTAVRNLKKIQNPQNETPPGRKEKKNHFKTS